MKSTIRLGKIAEVEVSLHLSWFAVLALLSWWASQKLLPWLARTVWPDNFVDWSSATYWAMGVLAALLLLVSVVVHELAHSVVAQARGFQVRGITLFLFGGFSSLRAEIKTARDEFVISVVGPAASLVLAGLLAGVFWVVLQVTQHRATPLATLLVYGALVNLLLVGLNLLPAFPLDGGRVVRSVIWAATGSFSKATVLATLGGQVVGGVLVVAGIFQILRGSRMEGFWMALVGWYVYGAAGHSRRNAKALAIMRRVHVRDVMETGPETVAPSTTVLHLLVRHFLHDPRAVTVCDDERVLGIITALDANKVPRELRSRVKVSEAMTPMPLWSVKADDLLKTALELMTDHSINQAPVLDNGRLVGMVSVVGITIYLNSEDESGVGTQRISASDTSE